MCATDGAWFPQLCVWCVEFLLPLWLLTKSFPAVNMRNLVLFSILWGLNPLISSFLGALSWSLSFIFIHQPILQKPAQDTGMEFAAGGGTRSETHSMEWGALEEHVQGHLPTWTGRPGPTYTSWAVLSERQDPNQASLKLCSRQMHQQRRLCPTVQPGNQGQGLILSWRSLRKVGKGRLLCCYRWAADADKKPSPVHTESEQILISLQLEELCQLTGTQTCWNWFQFSALYNNNK